MKIKTKLYLSLMALTFALPSLASAANLKDSVSRDVRTAIETKFPRAQWLTTEKEMDRGQELVEVALKYEGSKYEVKLDKHAEFLEIEQVVARDTLPSAIKKMLKGPFAQASLKQAEKVTVSGDTFYELEILLATQLLELKIDTDGHILHIAEDESEND